MKTSNIVIGKIESQQFSPIGEKFKENFLTPQGGFILACILGMILLTRFSGGKKKQGKLATGYFGSQKEMAQAKKKALEQIADPKCDRVALYIGRVKPKKKAKGQKAYRFAIPPSPKNPGRGIFYVPDVQRGTLVLGAPGSGKTVSAINPMLFSAVDRGLPIILYDFKYPSQSKVAVFAKRHGYDVRIFAPGFPESEVCNPIDFLRDANDGENARQIGTVINKNFKQISQGQEDAFFGPAGDQLVEAILMLTKSTPYPDIMMAAQILSSEKMVQRLMAADMNPWIRQSFGQLFSSASSEKTVAGIAGSASIMFTRFMKRNTLGCFVGQTTLPLDLKGKQLAIFGMDRERRAVCGPLLCSVMHMLIARNIAKRRQDPLVVCLDEFPTLYLPDIGKWLNESRSEGFCGILGAQGLSQIEQNYGKENAKTITTGTNTKILFNLGEYETARSFSMDKGLAVTESNADGGIARRLTGKLLTWMQDRTAPVLVLASVNRLQWLPPELTRPGRFDYIYYVDLPQPGERKEVMHSHLRRFDRRFANGDPFSFEQWQSIIKRTHKCSNAEVATIVAKAAMRAFCEGRPGRIEIADLLAERETVNPLALREADKIAAMRRHARQVGLPASAPDTSPFAHPVVEEIC